MDLNFPHLIDFRQIPDLKNHPSRMVRFAILFNHFPASCRSENLNRGLLICQAIIDNFQPEATKAATVLLCQLSLFPALLTRLKCGEQ
jgi:hypothetical protein